MEQHADFKTAGGDAPQASGRRDERVSAGDQTAETLSRLRFETLRSALYHDMCHEQAARTNRWINFLTVVLSSAAVAAFGSQLPILGQAGGVAVAVLSGIQLVWDFNGQAANHLALRRRFYELNAETGPSCAIDALEARMVLLYADEGPVNHRTNAIAHNRAGSLVYGPGNFDEEAVPRRFTWFHK